MDLVVGVILYLLAATVAAVVVYFIGRTVARWFVRNSKLIVVCVLAVIIGLSAIVFLPVLARGEGKHVTVVIVYYEEDTFIVEDDNGCRDLYDDRGDLVPGDELIIDGDDLKLYAQSNWVWFDVSIYEEPIASFLYSADAEEVIEHVKEMLK